MKKQEVTVFKGKLIDLKERILQQLGHIEDENLRKSQKDFSGDLSGYSLHLADAGTDNFDREFALGIASNQQEILREIDDALKRIEEKTYGKCQNSDCEADISEKRLNALPFAKFCIKCQGEVEKNK